jgi:hypothetical protein
MEEYENWKSCMKPFDSRLKSEIINRRNFSRFVELHNAIRSRDRERVARLSGELNVRVGGIFRDVSPG